MKDDELTNEAYDIGEIVEKANQEYIERLGKHVGDLMDEDEIDEAEVEKRKKDDLKAIKKALKTALAIAAAHTILLYQKQSKDVYKDMSVFYKAKKVPQAPFEKHKKTQMFLKKFEKQTMLEFNNLSKTTVVDKAYMDAVDKSIRAIQSGRSTYEREIRSILKNAAIEGTRVQYASGLTRRMDSAVRMNVLDGTRRVNMEMYKITGEEFGADGVEISAHDLCADDHIHIQGLMLSNDEFEDLNSSLDRPVGEMNCRHFARPIVMGVSKSAYSEEELQEMKENSEEEVNINGKNVSRYQCSQLMRKIETDVRYQKDAVIMAKASGDKEAEKKARDKITAYKANYDYVCKQANLKPQPKRMSVAGFTR